MFHIITGLTANHIGIYALDPLTTIRDTPYIVAKYLGEKKEYLGEKNSL
jgi:hypothetical protein